MDTHQVPINEILYWFLYCFLAIAAFDTFFTILVKVKKPKIENKYFDFHRRYGFIKVTIGKIFLIFFVSACLIDSSGNVFKLFPVIIIYAYFVIRLLIDFLIFQLNKS